MESSLNLEIKKIALNLKQIPKKEEIIVISHFDTDGITSAAIMIQALQKLDKKFSVKIIKSLEKEFIENLPKDKIILFLDLASGSIEQIQQAQLKQVFIIDHHEIDKTDFKEIQIINPHLHQDQKISAAGLVYLFCKEMEESNADFAKLAVLGMIGDRQEKEIGRLNNGILEDGEIKRKKGLLIYPSTRPLNRTLEYCSNPFIPDITGNSEGVLELLREVGLNYQNGKCKSLIELNEEEMEKLVTAITLRTPQEIHNNLIGEIFLIKMFNKLEDAREISAMINACSRLGHPEIALEFCLEVPNAKKKAEEIHVQYKQEIINSLKYIKEIDNIQGKEFVILNAKNKIKETIIGTVASILSYSTFYKKGTIIITMAYYEEKIKISLRKVGDENPRNLKDIISQAVSSLNAEVGGHAEASGAIIQKQHEQEFINNIKKLLEIEVIKIK